MLDAKKCATKFRSSATNGFKMCSSAKNFHTGTSYEEGSLWALQRFQGNLIGKKPWRDMRYAKIAKAKKNYFFNYILNL